MSALAPGDHVCWVYGSDDDHQATLGAYAAAGLRANEKVVYFAHRYGEGVVTEAIRRHGIDPDPARRSGQLSILPAEASYLPDGTFDPERMVDAFEQAAVGARDEGYERLRAAGEAAWLLPGWLDPDTLIAYEMGADAIVAATGMIAICGYDSRTCDPDSVARAQMAHPARIAPSGAAEAMFGVGALDDGGIGIWGELDMSSIEPFRVAVRGIAERNPEPVIDLGALRFIDLSCLRLLIDEAARIAPRRFTLRALPNAARRSLALLDPGIPPNLLIV